MAFSMNNMSSTNIHQGDDVPEIPEIITEQIGFKALNGDKKARILTEPWPDHDLPPPYASLLSVASARGLYAAAGPKALVIGKTQNVRSKIYSQNKSQDIVDCEPLHTFPHNRLSHVAFASDESCLVVAEQSSQQIIAYEVKSLIAGNSDSKIALATNASVRTIAPNPDPSQAHLLAVLNTNGQLLLANLQGNAQLVSGTNGPVLAESVTCIAWSTKGKQLLAGKADGTAVQLKPDGTVVAAIPKPESVPQDCHLAQIVWTETDVFVFIYTPSSAQDDNPESHYFVVKTNKARNDFVFRKTAADIVYPTVSRTPAYFHTARIRDYGPNLDDLICITATVSSDIKVITKSKQPLSGETAEENAYTVSMPDDESLQATMPMKEDASADTTAIGMAVDLSDNDSIIRPIVSDPEIQESEGPLPLLAALNNEGILRVWAIVYNEAVREKIPYSGFAEVKRVRDAIGTTSDEEEMDTTAPQQSSTSNQPVPAAAPTSSGQTSTFSTAPTNTGSLFGQPGSSFGTPSLGTGGGFSKPTPIGGETKSSWTSTGFNSNNQSTSGGFGAPGFGTTPTLGSGSAPAFGRTGAMGNAQQSPSSPAFGKTGFGGTTGPTSPFASAGNASSSPFATKPASGFSSFANQNGFGGAKPDIKTESSFAKFSGGSGFAAASGSSSSFFGAANSQPSSTFGKPSGTSAFGRPSPLSSGSSGIVAQNNGPFGTAGNSSFRLDSTFQKDETSKDDGDDDKPDNTGFGFSGLGNMLGGGAKKLPPAASMEADMGDDNDESAQMVSPAEPSRKPQETPPSTLSQAKTTTTPHISSLFGNQQQSTTPPTQQKTSTGWGFGNVPSTTPKDTPAPSRFIFGTQPVDRDTPAVVAHSEPNKPFGSTSNASRERDSESGTVSKNAGLSPKDGPEAPLPPNPSSKPGYQTGDTSSSSLNSKTSRETDDAPLPPDFTPAGKSAVQSIKTEDSELPPDSLSSDFEDSGDDLTGDVSPEEEPESGQSGADGEEEEEGDGEEEEEEEEEAEHVQTSPESSFGHAADRSPIASPTGGAFTKISKVEAPKQQPKPLFGELGKPGPIFAPPKPQPQQSPRSPSPVRKSASGDLFRPSDRSVSAPVVPKSFIQQKKIEHQQSPFAMHAAYAREEEEAKEAARIETATRAREESEAREKEPLVDTEDMIVRTELAREPVPNSDLGPFMTIQPVKALQDLSEGRTDIHSQIEILYEDINGMVNTLGINARSLKEYMLYTKEGEQQGTWPSVLSSDTPMDTVSNELFLRDVNGLPAGCITLGDILDSLEVQNVMGKLDQCQHLLTQDLTDLRARITAMRRSTQARAQPENNKHAPLSAEQSSIQQDLRKSSATVLTNLGEIEDELVVLRAKLADLAPSSSSAGKAGVFGLGSTGQKKPSVEAVINTVSKMTAMAEKKSADVDVLEAQLRMLNMNVQEVEGPRTPEHRTSRRGPSTPGSGASSVYHTPDSRGGRSARATPSRQQQMVVSSEDKDKWRAKARRRKDVAATLKSVLQAKHAGAVAQ